MSVVQEHEVALAKLQYDHKLACLGLQGTLHGAWAVVLAIVVIAVVQVLMHRYVVEGWAFVGLVAVGVVPVTAYGAFIFKRALDVSTEVAPSGVLLTARTAAREL